MQDKTYAEWMDICETMLEPSRKDVCWGLDLYETVPSEDTTEESDCQPQACSALSSSPQVPPPVDNKCGMRHFVQKHD
jgi:hypothetical protein